MLQRYGHFAAMSLLRMLLEIAKKTMTNSVDSPVTQALDAVARTEDKVHAYRHVLVSDPNAAETSTNTVLDTSPIHGWPFAVKEVFDVAGVPTSGGSQAYKDRIAPTDATVVRRLRSAGGVLLGTQVAHELTCGLDQPPTRNPWNLACYPGGSSAGAGVSVAVGSARFALGTDAAGSIRIPAAMTGTTGLKPTWGLISEHGVMRQASAPSIDHVGIIARSAAEIGLILPVLAGPDPWDAATLQSRTVQDDSPEYTKRIAVLGGTTLCTIADAYGLDPDVQTAFEEACAVFRDAGADLVELELPTLSKAVEAIVTLFAAELACANANTLAERRSGFSPAVADMIESGLAMSGDQIENAIRIRSHLRQELSARLTAAEVRFLLTPTAPRPAMRLARFNPGDELATLIPFTCGFNLTGNPAISLPCGQTRDRLPVGLQIVGIHFMEKPLLELAKQFQERTNWHKMRPPV